MKYKIVKINGWPPFIKWFMNPAAVSLYPWLIVIEGYEKHEWLIKHEEGHLAEQERDGTLRWVFKYLFSKKFRYHVELEAHAVSVKYGYPLAKAARDLSSNYGLKLSYREAEKEIQDAIHRL